MTLSYFKTANKLKQQGKLEEAIQFYRQAIEQNPNLHWFHHNLGEALAKIEKWDEVVAHYSQAIKLNPNSASSHHNLGEALANLGRWDEAIVFYRRSIDISPNSSLFNKKIGDLFALIALKIDLQFVNKYKIIDFLFQSENLNKYANELCYDLWIIDENKFLERSEKLNNYDFVERVYHRYLKREADESGQRYYLQLLHEGMSRQEFIVAMWQSPEFVSKWVASVKGVCFREAAEAYRRAIELGHNSNKCNQSLADALNQLGQALIQQDRLDEAIEIYGQVIDNCKNLGYAYYRQATVLYEKGQLNEAVDSYQKAIAINPDRIDAYRELGEVLAKLKLPDKAVECFQQGVSLAKEESDRIELEFKIASILTEQGELDLALLHVETALRLSNFPHSKNHINIKF